LIHGFARWEKRTPAMGQRLKLLPKKKYFFLD